MLAGLILAAGSSSRMGRPKVALPLGSRGQSVLSYGVSALLNAGVPRVVVVAGAHLAAVRSALGATDRRVVVVEHAGWARGQLSSLLCGLDAVDTPSLEAVLVSPADVPLVRPATIRQVMSAWRHSDACIVRPARGDRHGHPVLFDRRLFQELRAADLDAGAKSVVRAHAAETLNVPVSDEGAFLDMDVPADYERLQTLARALEGPSVRAGRRELAPGGAKADS